MSVSVEVAVRELSQLLAYATLTADQENKLYLLWLRAALPEKKWLQELYAPLFAKGLLRRCAIRHGHAIPRE